MGTSAPVAVISSLIGCCCAWDFTCKKIDISFQPSDQYTIIDLCCGRHGVLLNSKRHIDRRGAEVNMIKFTVQ